jgi:type II secretory pathway pseudopilin PulG
MQKNQHGFSVVEGLVVLVIIGLVGLAGWYVWDKNKSDTNSAASSTITTDTSQEKFDNVKAGYKEFNDSTISIQYPEKWTQFLDSDDPNFVFISSPDYEEPKPLQADLNPRAGYILQFRVDPSEAQETYDNSLRSAKELKDIEGDPYAEIIIDGSKAILSEHFMYGGTYADALTYFEGDTYYFRLTTVEANKSEVKDLLSSILETVKLK